MAKNKTVRDRVKAREPLTRQRLEALEQRYLEQLPTVAALLISDDDYEPEDVAGEAVELVYAILDELETEVFGGGGE